MIYARDPASSLAAFAAHLTPGSQLLVSHFRSGNYRALWRGIAPLFFVARAAISADERRQVWDIRALRPAEALPHHLR